jgi:hypothetical protein
MTVRIYQPTKTAMQSGRAKTRQWVLEYAPETASRPEPLMGWVAAADTMNQIHLGFESRDEAVAYAKKPRRSKLRTKAYADNFAFTRSGSWTH